MSLQIPSILQQLNFSIVNRLSDHYQRESLNPVRMHLLKLLLEIEKLYKTEKTTNSTEISDM